MRRDRRDFIALTAAGALGSRLVREQASPPHKLEAAGSARERHTGDWNAQWIWYPGQLAAYRHSRRVRLAMERCQYVGYPANFRQPQTEVYFRKLGKADRHIALRWAAPVARVRTMIGGRGGDITKREGILRKGDSGIEVQIDFAQRAVRFARFTTTGRAELSNVQFDARISPTKQKGRFESSDPDLNAIWATAVATLRSNMHDFYLDGIRGDGLIWHDGPLTLEAYERVFFDCNLSRQTLIAETMPARASIRDVGIIDSPMYDVIGFEREFLSRGDPAFSRMFRDRIEDMIQFYRSLQNEHGFVDAAKVEPYGFFPDWSAISQGGPDGHGSPAYGQMLLVSTFASAARLARDAWDDEARAADYAAAAEKLKLSIREVFWRPQEGLYINGFDRNGRLDSKPTSFAQAFAIACQIAKPDEYDSLFQFLNDESKRSAHYSLSQVVELTAYAQAGRTPDAIKRLKSAWLPIIQRGYRRFFEDIHGGKDPNAQLSMYGRKYAASLCHAWAGAAPVMALSRGVLGIEPIEPGYRLCRVAPQRCGLDWVKGSVPTPHGSINIEWNGSQGELTLPPYVSARLFEQRILTGPGHFPFVMAGSDTSSYRLGRALKLLTDHCSAGLLTGCWRPGWWPS